MTATAWPIPALDPLIVRRLPLLPGGELVPQTQERFVQDWSEPARWSLAVIDDRDTLLYRVRDGTEYEDLFEMPYLFDGCTSSAECKRSWFRHHFLRPHIDTTSVAQLGSLLDDVATMSYGGLATARTKLCGGQRT